MIFFHLHFKFVNFYQSSNDYVKCYFVIFFVHNTRTIDFQIYNIHNFLLKQSRVIFFFSGYTTAQLHGEHRLQVHRLWPERGSFVSFFFFYKTNRTKNTHTQKHTPRRPTQRRDSKDLLRRSFTPALPRQGKDFTNTDRKQLCCHCCSAENAIIIVCSCCTIAVIFEVIFPPRSLNSSGLPVASSFISSILRWKKLKKTTSVLLLYSNGKNVNILRGCLAWRYWEACLRADMVSEEGCCSLLRLASQELHCQRWRDFWASFRRVSKSSASYLLFTGPGPASSRSM